MTPVRPTLTVIGQRLDPQAHSLRDFLTRSAQPFDWIESDGDDAARILGERNALNVVLPVVIDGKSVLACATPETLVEAWGLNPAPAREEYDLVIVGAGPAGLAAAVYAASDGLSTLIAEVDLPGGQAGHTSAIENFFGFPDGIGGAELARRAGRQAERFGAELLIRRGVTGNGYTPDGRFTVEIAGGHEVAASAVIVAPGMVWRQLEVPGVDALLGRGIYYGAGRSEARQCGGDSVVVVGAGNSAGQAVLNLANANANVTMVVRGDDLGRSMSAYLVDRIAAHPLVDIRLRAEVEAVEAERDDGGERLAAVTIRGRDGGRERIPVAALFLCIGGTPRTAWAADSGIRVDRGGFILTGPDLLTDGRRPPDWPLGRDPLALETSVPGVFAAGDVRSGSTKRVAGAVGDGAMATALAHIRLDELRRGG